MMITTFGETHACFLLFSVAVQLTRNSYWSDESLIECVKSTFLNLSDCINWQETGNQNTKDQHTTPQRQNNKQLNNNGRIKTTEAVWPRVPRSHDTGIRGEHEKDETHEQDAHHDGHTANTVQDWCEHGVQRQRTECQPGHHIDHDLGWHTVTVGSHFLPTQLQSVTTNIEINRWSSNFLYIQCWYNCFDVFIWLSPL